MLLPQARGEEMDLKGGMVNKGLERLRPAFHVGGQRSGKRLIQARVLPSLLAVITLCVRKNKSPEKGHAMTNYAHPEVLVDPQWVADHLRDPTVRLIEVHLDPASTHPPPYETGHIPGAVLWNSLTTLLRPDFRLNDDKTAVEGLLSRSGVVNDTTVVLYSDHPAVAPWALWYLHLFGHRAVRVLNGGRKQWLAEGRPLTAEVPVVTSTAYKAQDPDLTLRALRDEVQAAVGKGTPVLLDVRRPQEYRGNGT